MKLRLFFYFLVLCACLPLSGQLYNPFVSGGNVEPMPLLPLELDGKGTATFQVGNTGSQDLYLRTGFEMGLVIGLLNVEPDDKNPLKSLKGDGAKLFSWTYISQYNSFIGKQKSVIKAGTSATITLDFKVTRNVRAVTSSCGFNVNLQPPPYANGENTTADDVTSRFTYTRATDYGDAPLSYGAAGAEIDYYKVPSTGAYERLVMLGDKIDHEAQYSGSSKADSDDKKDDSDEDGVKFPSMVAGSTVIIPVETTVQGGNVHYLNGWIDWNQDGDFTDAGERFTTATPFGAIVTGLGKKNTNLTVNIPATAKAGKTYARFRFGSSNSNQPSSFQTYGEVEDYDISIKSNSPALIVENSGKWNDINQNGRAEAGETVNYTFTVTNTGNTTLDNVVVINPMVSKNKLAVSPSILEPGQTGIATSLYKLNPEDVKNGYVYNKATASGKTVGGVIVEEESIAENKIGVGEEGYNASCPDCAFTKLSKGNEIRGVVWQDNNKNSLIDGTESFLEGQKVVLYNNKNQIIAQTETEKDGSYQFDYLENGSYYVKFIPQSGYLLAAVEMENETGNKVTNNNGEGTTKHFTMADEKILGSVNAGLLLGEVPLAWETIGVSRQELTNRLRWTVSSEKNVEKYIIYRRTEEDKDFNVVGEISANNLSEGLKNTYTFLDYNAASNGSYVYFIENVDKDQKRSKSKKVDINLLGETVIEVYPNPAINFINISTASDLGKDVEVSLYSENGNLIKGLHNAKGNLSSGQAQYDISDIIPGKYIVKLKTGDREFEKRIIVVK